MKKENRQMAKQRKAEQRRREERNQKIKKVLIIGVPSILIIVLVVWCITIALQEKKQSNVVQDSNNTVSTENLAGTEEVSDTELVADTEPKLNTDTSLKVEDGDTVNIDYVGKVDGVAFQGGDTKDAGTDLVIGSHSYIDDFEEQLIGHKPGDKVEVKVTFPKDYGKEELNGKEAVFETTINGIYK